VSDHDDINARKTLAEIIASLGDLVGMCLLFNRKSRYYKASGIVTETRMDTVTGHSALSIRNPDTGDTLVIAMATLAALEDLLSTCDAFVGHTPEDSFLLAS
jgi:hypothetical protein